MCCRKDSKSLSFQRNERFEALELHCYRLDGTVTTRLARRVLHLHGRVWRFPPSYQEPVAAGLLHHPQHSCRRNVLTRHEREGGFLDMAVIAVFLNGLARAHTVQWHLRAIDEHRHWDASHLRAHDLSRHISRVEVPHIDDTRHVVVVLLHNPVLVMVCYGLYA